MEAVHPDQANFWELYSDPMLWGRPVMLLWALDPAWTFSLALYAINCSQTQGAIQIQGCDPSLWNANLKNPFGGMPIVTGEAWTLYTVKHHGQVRQGHPCIADHYCEN